MTQTETPPIEPTTPVAGAPPSRPPSRMSRFGAMLLRWGAGLGAVFALGIIATWLVQVGPRTREITRLKADLEAANRDLTAAQAELEELRPLEEEFRRSEQRRLVLHVLVDIIRAQGALAQSDESGARQALRETSDRLAALGDSLGPAFQTRIVTMSDRLQLILREITSDPFAAQSDLSVLATNLSGLEREIAEGAP
ncbi:MAG: hypothetical protein ACRDG5_11880 [Anaerolineales bacterium]